MEKIIINVEGMSCSHCVNAVTNAVGGLDGVVEVKVDLKVKTVAVAYDSDKVTPEIIKAAIEEEGYDVI
ncbi:MAG: copper chaperone CopZ [Peptostreptococcaceae bacterium]|nr:copper chaperone CopZ [Peptostreptococcaceae bacterium]